MELIYLWVENYNYIIIDQEFYFTNEYKVKKDLSKGNVEIDDANNGVYNIFKNNKNNVVKNIFGIIGENGVGKTSIINMILENKDKGITIFKVKKSEVFDNKDFLILSSDNLNLRESENYCLMTYSSDYTKQWKTGFLVNKNGQDIFLKAPDKPHIIYYDNIFNPYKTYKDVNRSLYEWHKENKDLIDIDISTNFYFFHKNSGDKLKYVSNEIKNTIHYFGSDIYDEKSLQRPNKLIIKNVDSEIFKKEGYINFDYKSFEEKMIKNVVYIFFTQYITTSLENPYGQYNEVIFNELVNAFCDEEEKVKSLINVKFTQKENGDMVDSFRILIFDGQGHPTPSIKKYIEIIKAFKSINLKEISIPSKNKKDSTLQLEMHLSNENIKKISEFLSTVKENSIKKHFLDYSYDIDYSSGERGLLTLFTRLYVKYEEIKNSGQEEVLLLLDEPDILSHPEWQRTFIYKLKNFLEKVYVNKKVKVIVTSHSPFIASDLPKENVIMLEKSEDGKCIVEDKNINTFGANIFNLYKEAFFVKSSFGEFAKEKIQDVVNLYEKNIDVKGNITYPKEMEIENRKDEIKYIINSVGESLVKRKLQNMCDEYEKNKLINDENKLDNEEDKKLLEKFNKLSREEKLELMRLKKENSGDVR